MDADVTKQADIKRIASETEKAFGGPDILINNAGIGSAETIMEADDEKWQYYLDLHLMASIRLFRAIVPFMKKPGGRVVVDNPSICAK